MFKAEWKGFSKTLNKEISDNYSQSFSIPISDKVIQLTKPNPVVERNTLYANQQLNSGVLIMMASTGVVLLVVIIGLASLIIKINRGKSRYEQRISKILREFDRAITEAKGRFIRNENENYIEVNDFMELLDVHDNLNEPIIYYKNSSNTKSIFVVRNGTDIYYSIIKREEYD